MRLPGHVRAFVEGELRQHRVNKISLHRLKRERDDIYHRTRQPNREQVKGSHSGDPISAAVIMAEKTDRMIDAYELRVTKVEAGLEMCTVSERRILQARYMEEYEPTDEEVINYLRYGRRNTYFETRDKGLSKIAKAFGLWNEP